MFKSISWILSLIFAPWESRCSTSVCSHSSNYHHKKCRRVLHVFLLLEDAIERWRRFQVFAIPEFHIVRLKEAGHLSHLSHLRRFCHLFRCFIDLIYAIGMGPMPFKPFKLLIPFIQFMPFMPFLIIARRLTCDTRPTLVGSKMDWKGAEHFPRAALL